MANCENCGQRGEDTLAGKLFETTTGDMCQTCYDPFDLMAWDSYPICRSIALSDYIDIQGLSFEEFTRGYNLENLTNYGSIDDIERYLVERCIECGNTAQDTIDENIHICGDELPRCLECLKGNYQYQDIV